jgi:hypothetical protein
MPPMTPMHLCLYTAGEHGLYTAGEHGLYPAERIFLRVKYLRHRGHSGSMTKPHRVYPRIGRCLRARTYATSRPPGLRPDRRTLVYRINSLCR